MNMPKWLDRLRGKGDDDQPKSTEDLEKDVGVGRDKTGGVAGKDGRKEGFSVRLDDARTASGFAADGKLDEGFRVAMGGQRSKLTRWRGTDDPRAAKLREEESRGVAAEADLTQTGELSIATAISGVEKKVIGGERLEYGREVLRRTLEALGLRKDLFAFEGEVQARLVPKLVEAQRITTTADEFAEFFEAAGIIVESDTGIHIGMEMPEVKVGKTTRKAEHTTLTKKYALAEPYQIRETVKIDGDTTEWVRILFMSLGIPMQGVRDSLSEVIKKEQPNELEVIAALGNTEIDGKAKAHGKLGLIVVHAGEQPGEDWMEAVKKDYEPLRTEDGKQIWIKEKGDEEVEDDLDKLLAELDGLDLESGEAEAVRSAVTAATGGIETLPDDDIPSAYDLGEESARLTVVEEDESSQV